MLKSARIIFTLITLSTALQACIKKDKPSPAFHTLVLGNSITYSPANTSIGWNGNWGMAATALNKDFVHLLTARVKAANASSTLSFKNIAEFEVNFDTYDIDKNLKVYRDEKPDIVVLRIAENVTRKADSVVFKQQYIALLNYFKATNANVKILAVGSVWPDREMPEKIMQANSDYASLAFMQANLSNFAFGQFNDPGVQAHPSDKGMQVISDAIWSAMQKTLSL